MFFVRRFVLKEKTVLRRLSRCGKKYLSNGILKVHGEVEEALHAGKPVVALESAIITHGMPAPVNLQTARAVEGIVRENGCVPATVAVLDGVINIGLTNSELEELSSERPEFVKVSRRDLPFVISQRLSGGTTVSATMIAAHKANIPIFVTGGIGGVHRGAEATMDISADLTELGRTPVTVISAGVKSILDIPKTLEFLETQGVCVATYGKTKDFPAFFMPRSGYLSPCSIDNALDAAKLIVSGHELNLQSGNLIAVPIPDEFAASGEIIEEAIQTAIAETRQKSIHGREVTPYILRRVHELTAGQSMSSIDIALVKNNAIVGSQIAVELSRLQKQKWEKKQKGEKFPGFDINQKTKTSGTELQKRSYSSYRKSIQSRPVIVGGVVVDFVSKVSSSNFKLDGATYPGLVHQSVGGVGRNISDGLTRMGSDSLLISAVGDDPQAEAFFSYCKHMDMSGISVLPGERTATYSAILKSTGELLFGIGDMAIHSKITPKMISQFEDEISQASIVCMDGNITSEAIGHVCDICSHYHIPVWFEPTDIHKASKPFQTTAGRSLTFTSPNLSELRVMNESFTGRDSFNKLDLPAGDDLQTRLKLASALCEDLTHYIPVILVTLGKDGLLLCHRLRDHHKFPVGRTVSKLSREMTTIHFPAMKIRDEEILSVSGAGDCLVAGTISRILQGDDLDLCVKAGISVALESLRSYHAVPPNLSATQLLSEHIGGHPLQSSVR